MCTGDGLNQKRIWPEGVVRVGDINLLTAGGAAVRRECSGGSAAAISVPWPAAEMSSSSRSIAILAPSQEKRGKKMNRR